MHVHPSCPAVGRFPHVVLKPAGLLTAADDVDRVPEHRRAKRGTVGPQGIGEPLGGIAVGVPVGADQQL